MAYASMKTYLCIDATYNTSNKAWTKGSGSTKAYIKLVDIKDTPAFGAEPETMETTTLSNETFTTNIVGLQSLNGFSFTYNYTRDEYEMVKALAKIATGSDDIYNFAILLPDGGLIEWKGSAKTWINEISVNSVLECTVFISQGSEPALNPKTASMNTQTGEVTIKST